MSGVADSGLDKDRQYTLACAANSEPNQLSLAEFSSQHEAAHSLAPLSAYSDASSVPVTPALQLRGEESFHAFVQRIVDLFAKQRNEQQYQFAVLFLTHLPLSEITVSNMTFQTQAGAVNTPDEATDCSVPMFPPLDNLCNYMVARPQNNRHAEVRLMDDLETLLCMYSSLGMPQCRSLVLYSWLLPCLRCTEYIVKMLQDFIINRMFEVTVIYCSKQRDLKDEEIVRILNCFEIAGIEVLYVSYDQLLLRASRRH